MIDQFLPHCSADHLPQPIALCGITLNAGAAGVYVNDDVTDTTKAAGWRDATGLARHEQLGAALAHEVRLPGGDAAAGGTGWESVVRAERTLAADATATGA